MKLPHPAYQRPSPEAFHNLCVRAVKLYTKCFQQKSPRQCAYNGTLYTQVILRLQEGMYSVFLKDWLRLFPKKQIFLISFEQYTKFKVETVSAVWSFLGL
ncbi:sulfotransferase, partial [Elysia marginata]